MGWKKKANFIPFPQSQEMGVEGYTKMSLGGAPRTRQPQTCSAQVTQLAWVSSANARASRHRALFNFPDRTGADAGALRPPRLPSLLELFIN